MLLKIEHEIAFVSVATKRHPNAVMTVDAADLPLLMDGGPRWFAAQTVKSTLYAVRNVLRDGKRRTQRAHRVLLGENERLWDHHDRNGLNNTRTNLRRATHGQNMRNRGLQGRTSAFFGVSWCRAANKWKAVRSVDGVQHYFGVFTHEIDAALAYDAHARTDPFANLNFPEARAA